MEKLGVKKSGVLAVLLIVLFVTSFFSVFSVTTNAVKPVIVKIGVISDDYYLTAETALYTGVVQNDINAYVAKLPDYRFIPPVKFEFQVESMGGDDNLVESNAQLVKFHKEGINLIIGGWYSSQIDASTLSILHKYNMVMISPTANAPSLAGMDGNLFLLMPNASMEGTIVAAMFKNLGLTSAIVIERVGTFGSGVLGTFSPSFSSSNLFTYTYDPTDTTGTSFINALTAANTEAGKLSSVGVFLIAYDTDCAELNSPYFATNYPNLWGLLWFGTDGTANSGFLTEPNVAALKILSPNPAQPHNTKFDGMALTWYPLMGWPMGYSEACWIDAGWMLAQAVIETRPTWTGMTPGANDVKKVLIDDSSRYFGYSGWCQLDKNGDRVSGNWDIVGYGTSGYMQYGSYDLYSKTISWTTTP
jgi:ABC-type branched-subunit amino acid transport system substrate-binding protein